MAAVFQTIAKSQLRKLAAAVVKTLITRHNRKTAALVVLNGNLGSGKTTFTQAFARALKIRDTILSPTFVFVHEHEIPGQRIQDKGYSFKKLIHMDAYRIETKRDFQAIELKQYLKDPRSIVVIEWGDRIRRWLPEPDLVIEFQHHTPKLRRISFR